MASSDGLRRPDDLTPPGVPTKRRVIDLVSWSAAFAILYWAWYGADMRPLDLVRYSGNMAQFASDFLRPDFHRWPVYAEQMIVTVQIAIWGTVLAVVFAVPLGVLCAENVVPVWVYFPIRRLMDAARAINEVVFAVLFVVAVGLGPFAGTLAIFVHTTGILAKLFSEAVEAIDPRPVEGVRATGADRVHEVIYGIIPQSCRSGSATRSTGSNRTSARPPWWASSVPAASARSSSRRSAASTTPAPPRS